MDTFDSLPISAEIFGEKSGNYLCMHGGISPELKGTSLINKLPRPA